MNKVKYSIIVVLLIMFVLVLVIVFLMKGDENTKIDNEVVEIDANYSGSYEGDLTDEELKELYNEDYFIVKKCIQGYINYTDKTNNIYYEENENGANSTYNGNVQNEIVYSLLSQNYIKNNNVQKTNVNQYVQFLEESSQFYPMKIEIIKNKEIKVYKVAGILRGMQSGKAQYFYCLVNVDETKNTFSIELLNEDMYNQIKDDLSNIVSIEENSYNIFDNPTISNQVLSIEYLNIYKYFSLTNPKYIYEKMSEEYRNKRFGSPEEFEKYIKNNYNDLAQINATQYMVNNESEVTEYVVKDQFENIYIFDAKSIFDFNIKLDEYTIEDEKLYEKYDSADSLKKCQMNIDKFFQMINRADFRTSYNCLANTFKVNNIKTEQDFERIIRENLYRYNKVEYVSYENVGNNVFSYKLKIKDLTGSSTEEKNMTINIRLLENRNFEISFSL